MFRLASALLLVLICASTAQARSNGAPAQACANLVPQHPGVAPQTAAAPYMIGFNLEDAANIRVSIKGLGNVVFKGFLLQMVSAESGKVVGSWTPAAGNPAKLVDCAPGTENAITHVNSASKRAVSAVWVPPRGYSGYVKPVVSVVQDFAHFWVGIEGPRIAVGDVPDIPSANGAEGVKGVSIVSLFLAGIVAKFCL